MTLKRPTDFGPGYRVYFGNDGESVVILLGGSAKKDQQRAMERARVAWAEYKMLKARPSGIGSNNGAVGFERNFGGNDDDERDVVSTWRSQPRGDVDMHIRSWAAVAGLLILFAAPANAQDAKLLERGAYLMNGIVACGNCHVQRDKEGRPIAALGLSVAGSSTRRSSRPTRPTSRPTPRPASASGPRRNWCARSAKASGPTDH